MLGEDDDDEGFSQPAPIKTRDEVLLEVSLISFVDGVSRSLCVLVLMTTETII